MDATWREAVAGAPEGTVVLAEEQGTGRGRFQRVWVSPPGVNLYLSVLLRPSLGELPLLSMAAGVAVVRAVRATTGLRSGLKWPNDVLLGGRKVCGILVEGRALGPRSQAAVVGIGLNVNLDPGLYPEIGAVATSLKQQAGKPVSRLGVLRALLLELDQVYLAVRRGASVRGGWLSLLVTLGRRVRVRWGEVVEEGLAVGVDAEGGLVLERPGGARVTLPAGEVTLSVDP
jgi:BirA family biotin operon repressor/biotin-[acetyl-CoA-carboxylase] ligase